MSGGLPDGFPPDFVAALRLLGAAVEEVVQAGHPAPVLVGGAAVELWTSGGYVSGDFDLVTADPAPLEAALIARGFRGEDRKGWIARALYHPDLDIGIEFVSGALFDGLADRNRIVPVRVGEAAVVRVIPPEDVVADRLGQYSSNPVAERRQLALARMVYRLATDVDPAYLLERVRQEMVEPAMTEAALLRLLSDEDADPG
jgi:hypothetical protein